MTVGVTWGLDMLQEQEDDVHTAALVSLTSVHGIQQNWIESEVNQYKIYK